MHHECIFIFCKACSTFVTGLKTCPRYPHAQCMQTTRPRYDIPFCIIKRQTFTCASSWRGACGRRPWWPWPRTRAWPGSERTRSVGHWISSLHRACTQNGGVTYRLILDLLSLSSLEGSAVALVLETLGRDQSLDLGSLGVGLLALTLGLDLSSDDVLADLIRRTGISFTRVSLFLKY